MSDITSAEDRQQQAPDSDKLDGIVEQMRGDMSQGHVSDIADALRQRLDDASIVVTAAEFDSLVARLR